MVHHQPAPAQFSQLAARGNLLPIYRRIFGDTLTPVAAYRKLVRDDARTAPSFLLESVVGGDRQARYSFMGAQPLAQIVAWGTRVRRRDGDKVTEDDCADPLAEPARATRDDRLVTLPELPDFTGGWVGYAGYDTIRYSEGEKLTKPPTDDRGLPDMQFGLYRQVVAFDHVNKSILAITHVRLDEHDSIDAAYAAGCAEVDALVARLEAPPVPMTSGDVSTISGTPTPGDSNMTQPQFESMIESAKEYIKAGDIFQVVLSQRFERTTQADPFDIYRALRVVNPSPYMFYVQAEGCMLVGSSPEILCRVQDGVVTNRPLAGTRRRGATDAEDRALEAELLADPKERCEHIMLVDLGRNDVGRVAQPGSIAIPVKMEVERYSHVMHISSTVTGKLRGDCDCWDALRAALPVGTVSGAPKVRAMQIIDELEPTRRGPYAGAVGYADFAGNMDMAIALRTMVVMPAAKTGQWKVYLQAGAGIVADSVPSSEYQETVNKSAAMARAVDIAESAFANS
ncbi:MAG: anthranilate synthase component I [Planctomycetes bacterium]|nr:anthranilate synthase component I [Planctomycetota bacterium]